MDPEPDEYLLIFIVGGLRGRWLEVNSKAGTGRVLGSGVFILSKLGDRDLLLRGGVLDLSSAGDCDLDAS